jgi:hypothetical protein
MGSAAGIAGSARRGRRCLTIAGAQYELNWVNSNSDVAVLLQYAAALDQGVSLGVAKLHINVPGL